jgi:Fic family protein
MQGASASLWMLLGEARSKIDHIAESPLKPSVAQELHEVSLAKGILATTAIEGNTLSEEDARKLIAGTLRLPPSQEYLAVEMANVLDAFNLIKEELMAGGDAALTPEHVAEYNRLVLQGLELEEGVIAGQIRTGPAVVGPYKAVPVEDCKYLLGQLCEWLDDGFEAHEADLKMPFAILKAIMAHLYLVWIHPFGDGNGRTARLLELQILLAAGAPTPAIHLLSNHYNLTRADYYRHLHLASRGRTGDPLSFAEYAVRGFVDGLRDQLSTISQQQFVDRWEQFVYETFGERRTQADHRRLQLALDLSMAEEPVHHSRVRLLSPELAEAYAGTVRTVARDLNELQRLGLIERLPGGFVQPRSYIIRAFLPRSASPVQEAGDGAAS